MKKFLMLLSALSLAACSETLEAVSFRTEPDAGNVYTAGSDLLFRFGGNPDYITFYSGEPGHMLQYAGQTDPEGTTHYGIPVKAMAARESSFTYIYENPGEYEAAFVAKNASFEGERTAVVRLRITIAPRTDNTSDDAR